MSTMTINTNQQCLQLRIQYTRYWNLCLTPFTIAARDRQKQLKKTKTVSIYIYKEIRVFFLFEFKMLYIHITATVHVGQPVCRLKNIIKATCWPYLSLFPIYHYPWRFADIYFYFRIIPRETFALLVSLIIISRSCQVLRKSRKVAQISSQNYSFLHKQLNQVFDSYIVLKG